MGRVVCEGAECARQMVGRVSWRSWGMYLASQEARRWSHSGVGGRRGGQACRWRHGQLELEGAWLAALRKVGLQEGLASPLDEWDLGKTQKAHAFEWKLGFSGDRERWL